MKKHGEILSVPLIYLTVKERIKKSLDVPGPSIHKLFNFHMSDAAKYWSIENGKNAKIIS